MNRAGEIPEWVNTDCQKLCQLITEFNTQNSHGGKSSDLHTCQHGMHMEAHVHARAHATHTHTDTHR